MPKQTHPKHAAYAVSTVLGGPYLKTRIFNGCAIHKGGPRIVAIACYFSYKRHKSWVTTDPSG